MHRATIRLRPLRVACSLRAVPNALLTRLLVRAPGASRRASPAAVAAAPVRLLLLGRGGTPYNHTPPPSPSASARRGIPLARRRESWRAFASSTTAEDAEQRDQRTPVEPVKRQRFDMVYDHVTLTDDERELFKLLCETHPPPSFPHPGNPHS